MLNRISSFEFFVMSKMFKIFKNVLKFRASIFSFFCNSSDSFCLLEVSSRRSRMNHNSVHGHRLCTILSNQNELPERSALRLVYQQKKEFPRDRLCRRSKEIYCFDFLEKVKSRSLFLVIQSARFLGLSCACDSHLYPHRSFRKPALGALSAKFHAFLHRLAFQSENF